MSWATGVVVVSLVVGFGLVAAGWLTSGGIGSALTTSIGDATWDFSKSWASNVTVVGAILGTVPPAGRPTEPPSNAFTECATSSNSSLAEP